MPSTTPDPSTAPDKENLFIVYTHGAKNPDVAAMCGEAMQLDESLCLVITSATRSQLYHRIKREAQPQSLFVSRLEEQPKFMGMAEGSLKWLRERDL